MNLSIFSCLLLIIITSSIISTQAEQQTNFHLDQCLQRSRQKVHKLVLDNGFTALLYQTQPESKSPEVITSLTFDVGSRDEKHGQFGFAHAVEHMIFKGTEKMSELDLQAIAEKFCIGSIGIGYNAHTGLDATTYYFKTDEKNWPVFVGILADCMQNVSFAEHHFASEVKAIVNELKMYSKDPNRLIYNILGEELFASNHPYHHPLGGFKEDLLRASAADVKKFYTEHYSPDKGLFIVVGNVEKEQFERLVRENFENIPTLKNNEQSSAFLDFPDQQLAQKKIVIRKHIPAQIVAFTWKTLQNNQDRSSVIAQDFVKYVLQERLRPLKDEHDLVLGIYATGYIARLGGGLSIVVNPKDEKNRSWFDSLFNGERLIKRCKKFILEQLNNLSLNGPTAQELSNYKRAAKISLLGALEHNTAVASILEQSYFTHRDEYQIFNDLEFSDALDACAIQTFCKQYLTPSRMHTISFEPIKGDEEKEWLEFQKIIDTADEKLLNQRIRETAVEEERLVHELPEPELIDFELEKPDLQFTLANGLDVIIKQKPNTPFIALTCEFKNNEKRSLYLDSKNQEHIKTLAMSLLIEGSDSFSKKDHIDFFDRLGVSYNFGSAGGYCSCLLEDINSVLERFVHILTRPTFPRSAFKQAVSNNIETIKQNQQREFYIAGKAMGDYLFKGYPWRKNDEQSIQLLESTWRHNLFQLHKRYVTPKEMFVTLVGDINKETIRTDLEKVFGSWKAEKHDDDSIGFIIPEIDAPTGQTINKEMPKEMAILMLARLTTYADTDDDLALDLLEQYLNKQIFAIREQTGVFYGCSGSLTASRFLTKGAAQIATMLIPQNISLAEKMLRAMLQSIAQNGIPEYDLNIAKQTKRMALAKSFATNGALCKAYSFLIRNNKDWNYFEDILERLNALTVQDVNEVAKRYLDPSTWTTVKVGRLNNVNAENIPGNLPH